MHMSEAVPSQIMDTRKMDILQQRQMKASEQRQLQIAECRKKYAERKKEV